MAEAAQGPAVGKRLFRVALFAVGAKLVFMDIGMAGIAIGERHLGKFLEVPSVAGFHLMALPAVHRFVLPGQGVVRVVVVKIFGWRKCRCRVAVIAPWAKGVLMDIIVAVRAGRAEAEEGVLPFFQIPVINKIGDMALAAVNFGVRPGEVIPRQPVVEISLIEAHHVELAPVVVAVTVGAVLCLHLPGGVEAPPFVEQALDFGMAGEAFLVGNFFAQFMALGAIGKAFEMGMGLGEVAGGELGGCFFQKEKKKQGRSTKQLPNWPVRQFVSIKKFRFVHKTFAHANNCQ